MVIFLAILIVLVIIITLLLALNLKIYLEFDNVKSYNFIKIKAYAFSKIPVFIMKKKIENDGQKKTIKDRIDFLIDYFAKSKADPVDYAKKKVKKSDKVPAMLKNIEFDKIYLEKLKLNLCLDFDNAALSAIATGGINAIMGMVLSKYADNIKGPVNYNIFPGYTGNGIKIEVILKLRVRAIHIVKLFFAKKAKLIKNV
ncbi:MAG: hypothetical protein J6M02_06005 [Clostridia bacterium]|nr:hypothetical protein [Clostridia bacterium]